MPRLSTLVKPSGPDLTPLTPTSNIHSAEMASLALSLAGYIPPWLAQIYSGDPQSCYKALQKCFNEIVDCETRRLGQPHRINYSFGFADASKPENLKKNRYSDVLPFAFSGVKLPLVETGDYINASHIYSLCSFKHYIACQGPLPSTFADFWEMVWIQNSGLIVNLTLEEEKGRIKCHRYWPSYKEASMSMDRGNVHYTLSLLEEATIWSGKATQRLFLVARREGDLTSERRIHMIHFLDWPDHGASSTTTLLELVDLANALNGNAKTDFEKFGIPIGPMIVHCSAGIGRTGTFCVLDSVLHHLSAHQGSIESIKTFKNSVLPFDDYDEPEWSKLPLDLVALQLNHVRKQRPGCVQTFSQFSLIYDCLLARLKDWKDLGIPSTWQVSSVLIEPKTPTSAKPRSSVGSPSKQSSVVMPSKRTSVGPAISEAAEGMVASFMSGLKRVRSKESLSPQPPMSPSH